MTRDEIRIILKMYINWRNTNYIEQLGGEFARRNDCIYRTFTESEIINEYATKLSLVGKAMNLRQIYEKEIGQNWWINPVCHGEQALCSDGYMLWLENKVEQFIAKEQLRKSNLPLEEENP